MHDKSKKKRKSNMPHLSPSTTSTVNTPSRPFTRGMGHGSRYAGSPGAHIIDLGNKSEPTKKDVINSEGGGDDNMSRITNMSQLLNEELIECLKTFKTSKTSQGLDSASKSVNGMPPPADGDEDDSQKENVSLSGSPGSSDESHSSKGILASGEPVPATLPYLWGGHSDWCQVASMDLQIQEVTVKFSLYL